MYEVRTRTIGSPIPKPTLRPGLHLADVCLEKVASKYVQIRLDECVVYKELLCLKCGSDTEYMPVFDVIERSGYAGSTYQPPTYIKELP